MSFKDKPKREGGKPFARDSKKTNAPRKNGGSSFSGEKGAPKFSRKPAVDAAEAAAATADKPERISKILARAGIASRRDVERMIMEGRVSLNGKVLETPVVNATLADKIEVDGQPIRGIERTRLWLYHKPAGLVTTNSDPEGRSTVFENLPDDLPRVMSIGRLDINTEGLLLLTNDGGLSRVLELPTTGWLRRYRVRAHGEVSQEDLDKLKDGIAVDGVLYGSIDATLDRTQGHNVWITMGLREGKNREIKNVLGALGLDVNRLIRISYGPFQLGDLPEGHVVEVRGRMLRDQLGPRLIEESKANFDAPIYSNPVADEEKPQPKAARTDGDRGWTSDRGERTERDDRGAKPRREGGDRFGDKPKGRFGDKPAGRSGGKFQGKSEGRGGGRFDEEQPKKRPPMGSSRTANVWMAPGARPTADGVEKKSAARAEAERFFKKDQQETRRSNVNRVEGDSDWIRAESPPERSRDEGDRGFGGRGGERRERSDRPPFRGDRPDRGERSERPARSDRPFRGEKSDRGQRPDNGDRPPRGERPFRSERPDRGERSDRPARADRPFRAERTERSERPDRGDRPPRSDRPFRGERPERSERPNREGGFGRPQGERGEARGKPFGERGEGRGRPSGERDGVRGGFGGRSEGGRPEGGRPFGGKPGGGKSFGGKPGGGKSFGGKPGGGKPSGGRPGGKPSGSRGPGSGPKGGGNRSRGPRG